LLVWGDFTSYAGLPTKGLARILSNGNLDGTFDTTSIFSDYARVNSLLGLDGNNLLISVSPSFGPSVTRKVLENGTLDPDFVLDTFPTFATKLTSGKIVYKTSELRVLNEDLSPDLSFVSPLPSGTSIMAIARCPNGNVVVVGFSSGYRFYFLSADCRTLLSEQPIFVADGTNSPNSVGRLRVFADGRILLAGSYANSLRFLNRYLADGTLDPSFQCGLQFTWSFIDAISIQADGKILLGGRFEPMPEQPTYRPLLRLMPDGTFDPTFDLRPEGEGTDWSKFRASSLGLMPNGDLAAILTPYSGWPGSFGYMQNFEYSVQPKTRLVRLRADGPQPPHRPMNLVASSLSRALTRLTWNPVPGAQIFRVEKRVGLDWIEIGSTPLTTFDDSSVDGITNFPYRVIAQNEVGASTATREVQVALPGPFKTGLAIDFDSPSSARVVWPDVTGEWGYEVYRFDGIQPLFMQATSLEWLRASGALIATIPPDSTSFVDTSVTPRTAYSYVVAGVNVAGGATTGFYSCWTPSDQPPIAPSRPAVSSDADQSITLTWRDALWEEGYLLEWRPRGGTWATLANLSADTTTFTTPGGLPEGQLFEFRLTASNPFGGLATPTEPVSAAAQEASWLPAGEVDPNAIPFEASLLLDIQQTADGGFLVHTGILQNPFGTFIEDNFSTQPRLIRYDAFGRSLPFSYLRISHSEKTVYLPLADARVLIVSSSSGFFKLTAYPAQGSVGFGFGVQTGGFSPPEFNGPIHRLSQLKDGSILVAGEFTGVVDFSIYGEEIPTDPPVRPANGIVKLAN
jgi:uncharacterized delta-60 repeat protein